MYASPFIDETFDLYNCRNYILSIQCALDGFSFSIFDTTVQKFIVLFEYDVNTATPFELSTEIEKIVVAEPILNQHYKKVQVAYSTMKLTIVPQSLAEESEIETIFDSTFERSRDEGILTSNSGSDFIVLSVLPRVIEKLFLKLFTNCHFTNTISALLSHDSQQLSQQKRMLIYKQNHSLFLMLVEGSTLLFQNAFFVKNETDCLYYILNAVKQLSGNSKTEMVIYGKVKPKSEIETALKKYFEKVALARFNNNYSVSYTLYKEPENYHLTTLELALCE